jgi:glycosyltransferase A (GT-A) superfamily protein (DUF2064 family)
MNNALIDSDLPPISSDIINQAISDLDKNNCVLGPSIDGGYYLIALNNTISVLFEGPLWSTPPVIQQTILILDKMGLTFSPLPELEDIDTSIELISFYHAFKDMSKTNPDFPTHSCFVTSRLI